MLLNKRIGVIICKIPNKNFLSTVYVLEFRRLQNNYLFDSEYLR